MVGYMVTWTTYERVNEKEAASIRGKLRGGVKKG